MKQRVSGILLLFLGVVALAATAPEYPFKGSRRCRACHNKKETGDQYKVWKDSGHSNAFEALSTDQAKKAAGEKGIQDPQTSKECLKCHVTAAEVDPKLLRGLVPEEGVSCETCHGPGGHYWRSEIMKDPAKAKEMGLLFPRDQAVCLVCHGGGCPCETQAFVFEASLEKIKHWGFIKREQAQ